MNKSLALTAVREYRFAVVDPVILNLLPEDIIAQILVPKCLSQSAHLMPGAVDLQQLSEDRLNALCTILQGACEGHLASSSVAIFVATLSDTHEFARRWNAVQLVRRYNKRNFWLRIHDSRVLHQLLRMLNPMQRRGLFGQAQRFHYWIGNSWTTALREAKSEAEGNLPSIGPIGWDWARIERIGIVNRALISAGIQDLRALESQAVLAEQLIERAVTRHRLSEQADLIEYATRGLLFDPLFDEHPAIASAIKLPPASEETTSLSDRLALIEDTVWASLH
ncbi:DUF4123 domain-containing protein [Massilia sp. UMI-21]|nr:DUF4123 domain-containing protein [Massilia sp. UMI-21]